MFKFKNCKREFAFDELLALNSGGWLPGTFLLVNSKTVKTNNILVMAPWLGYGRNDGGLRT